MLAKSQNLSTTLNLQIMDTPNSFLFLCLGNICRSPMAHYLAQDILGDDVFCDSAGLYGETGSPATADARKAMRLEFGIDMSKHIAKHLNKINLNEFDAIICLDEEVYKHLVNKVPAQKLLNWHVEDPYYYDYNVYVQCSYEIRNKLLTLKPNK